MESQWNDLSTDNLSLSDELSAPGVYEVGKETTYARSKTIRAITLSISTLLIATGGVLGISSLNPFLTGLPEITNPSFDLANSILSFSFDVKNDGNYTASFYIQAEKANEPLFDLDISSPGHYEGIIEDMKIGIAYQGRYKVTNGFDYQSEKELFSIDEKGAFL